MTEPMSDERLAEIREELDLGTGVLSEETATDLLAEVEQLRTALKTVKIRSIQRELQTLAHTALYGTKKKGGDRG